MADDDAIFRATREQLRDTVNDFSASSDRISRTMRDSTNGLSTQFYRLSSTSNLTSSYVEQLGKTAAVAGGVTGDLAKEFLEIDRAVGIFASGLKDAADDIASAGASTGDTGTGTGGKKGGDPTKGAWTSIKKALGDFSGGLTSSAGGLSLFKGAISGAISPLTAIGAVIGAGSDVVMDSFHGWRAATKAGALFSGSLVEYGHAVAETRLSTGQFNKILGDTSSSLSLIGGTVGAGAEQFSRLAGIMRSTSVHIDNSGESVVEKLSMLGISAEESGELVGSFLSRQSMAATISSMSQQELAEATTDYMSELTQLSQLTGKNRKAIADEIAAKEKDAQFRAMLAGLDADQREGVGNAIIAMTNLMGGLSEVDEVMQSTMAGMPIVGESAQIFAASEAGTMVKNMALKLKSTIEAGGDPMEALGNNIDMIATASSNTAERFEHLAKARVEGYEQIYVGLADTTVRMEQMVKKAIEKTGDVNISYAEALQIALEDDAGAGTKDTLTNAINEAFVLTEGIKAGLKKGALTVAESMATTLIPLVREALGPLGEVGFKSKTKTLADNLDSTITVVNSANGFFESAIGFFQKFTGVELGLTDEQVRNLPTYGASADIRANYNKVLGQGADEYIHAIEQLANVDIKDFREQYGPGTDVTSETLAGQIIAKYANDPNAITSDTATRDEFLRAIMEGKDTENNLIKDVMEGNLKKDGKTLAALLHELLTVQKESNMKMFNAVTGLQSSGTVPQGPGPDDGMYGAE